MNWDRKLTVMAVMAAAFAPLSAMAQTAEVEPNNNKGSATPVTLTGPGPAFTGVSTGASTTVAGLGSADYFRIKMPTAAPGIYRNRLQLTPATGYTFTVRGLTQTGGRGVPGSITLGTDAVIQTATASAIGDIPARSLQWFGFGKGEELFVRVTGATTTTGAYTATLLAPVAVTPVSAPTSISEGSIRISDITGGEFDSTMWVYDSNFNAIAGFGNEDPFPVPSSNPFSAAFTRTFTPGTYYLAYSRWYLSNNQVFSADDALAEVRMDFPNIIVNRSSTATSITNTVQFQNAALGQTFSVPVTLSGGFTTSFVQFTVAASVVPTPPTVAGVIDPSGGFAGDTVLINATVTPGTNTTTTGHTVTADFSSLPGGSLITLTDSGNNLTFSAPPTTIPTGTPPGIYSIPFTVTASDARTSTSNVDLVVYVSNARCEGAIDISAETFPHLTAPVSLAQADPALSGFFPADAFFGVPLGSNAVFYKVVPTECGEWTFSVCSSVSGTTALDTVLSVVEAPTGCAGPLTLVAFNDEGCGTGSSQSSLTTVLNPGSTYYVVIGNYFLADAPEAPLDLVQLSASFTTLPPSTTLPPAPVGFVNEDAEPNSFAADETVVNVGPGGGVIGITTGDADSSCDTDESSDRFRINLPAPNGLLRYRATISSPTDGQTMFLVRDAQIAGIRSADEVFTASTSTALPRTLQWYASGNAPTSIRIIVIGTAATTSPYTITLSAEAVTVEEPFIAVAPGTVTLTTRPATTDTGIIVLDSNYNEIPDFVNEDEPAPGTSQAASLTREFAAGTYFIGVSNFRTTNSQTAPLDDSWRTGSISQFPGISINTSTAVGVALPLRVTDSLAATQTAALTKAGVYDIVWVRLDVGSTTPGCGPADIANTDGDPGADGAVDNGDFTLFFAAFFAGDLVADIANTDGDPTPDGAIDNGDFTLFFAAFFTNPCNPN